MKLDNMFMKDVKTLSLVMEYCESYDYSPEDILDIDIDFEQDKSSRKKNKCIDEYNASNGYIVIASTALKKPSSLAAEMSDLEEEINEEDYYINEKILCDLCVLTIEKLDGEMLHIYVPYDPLCDYRNDAIEMSNCPSAELLDDGNLKVLIGDLSKSPRRVDNNYKDLILGWEDLDFSDKIQSVLECEVMHISTFGKVPMLSVDFKIRNKNAKGKKFCLIFEDYANLSIDRYTDFDPYCELLMSKMIDGRIFVVLFDYEAKFDCAGVRLH